MNSYSDLWFKTFLETIPLEQTQREITFLERFLPQPRFSTILDVCCGEGRHTRYLAARGYSVTGLDCDERAIEVARRAVPRARFIVGDMRGVRGMNGSYDAVLCLWQSFGHFDDATNEDVIKQVAEKLNPRGRFILDIYHREFFEAHQSVRLFERGNRTITENKKMFGNRLTVELDYSDGSTDQFEWQLYNPDEIRELGQRFGLEKIALCSDFDETVPASAISPRMQVVFEKR